MNEKGKRALQHLDATHELDHQRQTLSAKLLLVLFRPRELLRVVKGNLSEIVTELPSAEVGMPDADWMDRTAEIVVRHGYFEEMCALLLTIRPRREHDIRQVIDACVPEDVPIEPMEDALDALEVTSRAKYEHMPPTATVAAEAQRLAEDAAVQLIQSSKGSVVLVFEGPHRAVERLRLALLHRGAVAGMPIEKVGIQAIEAKGMRNIKAAGLHDRLHKVERALTHRLSEYPTLRDVLAKELDSPDLDASALAKQLLKAHAHDLVRALRRAQSYLSEEARSPLYGLLTELLPYLVDWREAQLRMREYAVDENLIETEALEWELPLWKEASVELLLAGADERPPTFEIDGGVRVRGKACLLLPTLDHLADIRRLSSEEMMLMVVDALQLAHDEWRIAEHPREEDRIAIARDLLDDARQGPRQEWPYLVIVDSLLGAMAEEVWGLIGKGLDDAGLRMRRMRLTGRPARYERNLEMLIRDLKRSQTGELGVR